MSQNNEFSSSPTPKSNDNTIKHLVHIDNNLDGGRYGISSFESGYTSGTGLEGLNNNDRFQVLSFDSNNGLDVSTIHEAANYSIDSNHTWSRYGAEVRGAGLFVDSNPQIIRRETPVGVQTYKQTVQIRLLQPPPAPAPGPLIIKEVRAPQPPPLPPLRIRQQEPPASPLPPLVFRERPPLPPEPLPAKTVIKNLPALPLPPRSVIIERYPAPPPPPRDIIIERWLPYAPAGERKTIVERAEDVRDYEEPRNVIIEYEQPEVRVVRQFQQLGVTRESPQAFLARYGEQLLDSDTLVRHVRAANVTEDISIPAGITYGSNSLAISGDTLYGSDIDTGVSTSYSNRNFKRMSKGGHGSGILIGSGKDNGHDHHSLTYETTYTPGSGIGSRVLSTGTRNVEARF